MYGFVNHAFQKLIELEYGLEVWEEIWWGIYLELLSMNFVFSSLIYHAIRKIDIVQIFKCIGRPY